MSNLSPLKFRTKFSQRLRTGKRCKRLNSRTKLIENNNPILIVDLTYLENILNSKKKYKNSNLHNASILGLITRLHSWLFSAFKITNPSGIIFTAEKITELTKTLNYDIIYNENLKNTVFTLLVQNKILSPVCIFSNNLELWSLASPSAQMSFIAMGSSDRLLYYNYKTGLDILSKFIGTYKIINKLGLDNLKYLNLQYMYILLFYIQFTNQKYFTEFYFDPTFFKNISAKPFSKSKGLGLELITNAHKLLSYAFLTKPEFLDYFLLGEISHYSLNLQRLQKLLPLDLQILESMKRAYNTKSLPKVVAGIKLPCLKPVLPVPLAFTEPQEKKEKVVKIPKSDDTTIDSIRSFVANLLSES